MALYWAGMLYSGYPAYAGTALAVTIGVLALAALKNGGDLWESFLAQVGNNNWVLRAAFFMLLGVIFLWWADPPAPEFTLNPITQVWNSAREFVNTPLEDPLGETGCWATINQFFFGKGVIGWGVLTFHLWATFWGIFVSRWDEVVGISKEVSAKAPEKGFGTFLIKDGIAEIFWKVLTIPFRIFR